jgi:ElaB/YqjD/DUF883 family membrane-anchored ribosome-binding protein
MKNSEQLTPDDADGNGALRRGIRQAESGAHHTIDKAAEAVRPTVDRVASGAHHVVDEVAQAAKQTADSVSAKGEQLKNAEQQMVEYSREYMQKHPIASLGIAVAAGFLLSRILSSR